MKQKLLLLAFCLPLIVHSQKIEKVIFDPKDSSDGYYLAIEPQSKINSGVLVLFTSFISPENLLPETKLHNTAFVNDLLTVVVSTKQKLYADSSVADRINTIINHVIKTFNADKSKFAISGYDEAGGIALRYTELAYQYPSQFAVQPKAVFGIDASVDVFDLWNWTERQIKKNYWQGSVGDAKFYLDAMNKEHGNIIANKSAYQKLTPFNMKDDVPGNEKYLHSIPVRLYYDTDIEWQLKNRNNGYPDTKWSAGSELISRLLLAGNNKAEFISSKQPGMKANGLRHTNSISIVDEVDCIHWIKNCLGIFDPVTWTPSYNLLTPKGWGTEHFPLPPAFADAVTYTGIEDIRFTPGWGNPKSIEHWAYSYLWWLDGSPAIDEKSLQSNLQLYYSGLIATSVKDNSVPTVAKIKKTATVSDDVQTFNGTISMLDYHEKKPIVLNVMIHVKPLSDKQHTAVYIEVSPQSFDHPVWKKMNLIGDSFELK